MGKDAENEAEISKTRLRLWISLLRFMRTTESDVRERFRTGFSTTLPRFDVLSALHRNPDGLKMSELSELLLVSNGSATVVVDRLVKDGLVERKPVPGDRRALLVTLTDTGASQFLAQAQEHEIWINELFANISPKQAKKVIKILDRK